MYCSIRFFFIVVFIVLHLLFFCFIDVVDDTTIGISQGENSQNRIIVLDFFEILFLVQFMTRKTPVLYYREFAILS